MEENRQFQLCETLPPVVAKSGDFTNTREVFLRCKLAMGRYVILPSTFDAGIVAPFMLRLFTEHKTFCHRLTHAQPPKTYLHAYGLMKYPVGILLVTIHSTARLPRHHCFYSHSTDFYTQLACDGKKSRTPTLHLVADKVPVWESSHLFYLCTPATAKLQLSVKFRWYINSYTLKHSPFLSVLPPHRKFIESIRN